MGVWIETPHCLHHHHKESVTPFVGVWIETYKNEQGFICYSVTPFVGVWIETELLPTMRSLLQSHPSWVCGLKPEDNWIDYLRSSVTPFVGVWIETKTNGRHLIFRSVTPFVGVWIETRPPA